MGVDADEIGSGYDVYVFEDWKVNIENKRENIMKWIVSEGIRAKGTINSESAELTFLGDVENTYVELEYELPFNANGNEYVFFPACCYDGNRFDVNKKMYPPLFTPEEAAVDMPITITDVPRLEKDGSGIIEVTTGDLSIPCVGV